LIGPQIRIVDEEGGAVGAHDLIVRAHIEVNVRMVDGRSRAHALKLFHTDMDFFDSDVVMEMRYSNFRHQNRLSAARAARYSKEQGLQVV
jgi:hypothetical protein